MLISVKNLSKTNNLCSNKIRLQASVYIYLKLIYK